MRHAYTRSWKVFLENPCFQVPTENSRMQLRKCKGGLSQKMLVLCKPYVRRVWWQFWCQYLMTTCCLLYFWQCNLKTVMYFHTAHLTRNRCVCKVGCSLEMSYSCFSGIWAHSWWSSIVVPNRNHARTWLVSVFYRRTDFWLVLANSIIR